MEKKRYAEIGINYRFFLGWRHAAFAGNLVVLYGVLTLTLSIYKEIPLYAWLVPAVTWPIGILLWIIDVRTRDLYHAAMKAGKELEGKDGGFFTELSKVALSEDDPITKKKTQSLALNILFVGSSLLLIALAIFLLFATR